MEWKKPGHVYVPRPVMDVSSVDSSLQLSSDGSTDAAIATITNMTESEKPDDPPPLPPSVITQAIKPAAISPATYLAMTLKNHKLPERIDPFSLEQALYFEPYQESDIPIQLLQALRSNDLERLQAAIATTSEEKHSDDPLAEMRNSFGESLAHLTCRQGLSTKLLEYLVTKQRVPLNVRDKFGRSPLHNACMSPAPNFETITFLLEKAPKLFLFEDDSGKTPLEGVPSRCYDRWTRFIAESAFLKRVTKKLEPSEQA